MNHDFNNYCHDACEYVPGTFKVKTGSGMRGWEQSYSVELRHGTGHFCSRYTGVQ